MSIDHSIRLITPDTLTVTGSMIILMENSTVLPTNLLIRWAIPFLGMIMGLEASGALSTDGQCIRQVMPLGDSILIMMPLRHYFLPTE